MSVTVLAMNNAHLLLLKLKTNYVDFQHCDRWPNKHTVDDTCNHVTLDSQKGHICRKMYLRQFLPSHSKHKPSYALHM